MSYVLQGNTLINFETYLEGKRYVGVADATLPELSYMSENLTGAGIGGAIDMPTIGMVDKMSTTIKWRVLTAPHLSFAGVKPHAITFMGAQQCVDSSTGEIVVMPISVSMRAYPKKIGLGSFKQAAEVGSTTNMEVIYLKVEIDGKTVTEIDKLNNVCTINGVDYLSDVRRAMGL